MIIDLRLYYTNPYSMVSENPKSREELAIELPLCRDAAVPEEAAATERESDSLSATVRFPPRPRVLQEQ
jgi:hypothetical protein